MNNLNIRISGNGTLNEIKNSLLGIVDQIALIVDSDLSSCTEGNWLWEDETLITEINKE